MVKFTVRYEKNCDCSSTDLEEPCELWSENIFGSPSKIDWFDLFMIQTLNSQFQTLTIATASVLTDKQTYKQMEQNNIQAKFSFC